jgi:hypothetical protein
LRHDRDGEVVNLMTGGANSNMYLLFFGCSPFTLEMILERWVGINTSLQVGHETVIRSDPILGSDLIIWIIDYCWYANRTLRLFSYISG